MEKREMFYNQWWFWAISFASLIIVVSVIFYSGNQNQSDSFANHNNSNELNFSEDASDTFPSNIEFNDDVLDSGKTYTQVMDGFLDHLVNEMDEDDLFSFEYDSVGTIYIDINEGESKIYDLVSSHKEGTYDAPDDFFDLLDRTILAVIVETERHVGENLTTVLRVDGEYKITGMNGSIQSNLLRR